MRLRQIIPAVRLKPIVPNVRYLKMSAGFLEPRQEREGSAAAVTRRERFENAHLDAALMHMDVLLSAKSTRRS